MTTVVKKIWQLHTLPLTESDVAYVQGLGCNFQISEFEPQEITMNGKIYQMVAKSPMVTITTTCEKQECMLKLKYGDELQLRQLFHTISDTYTLIPNQ